MTDKVTQISKCRICGNTNLISVLSLGDQYVVNFVTDDSKNLLKAPLDLVLCDNKDCSLLQLKHSVERDEMYAQYWYQSGMSTLMVAALKNIVDSAKKLIPINAGDAVIDIGANDGSLLVNYDSSINRVGFEPSNLHVLAQGKGLNMIHDYFNHTAFSSQFGEKKAKIITSIAMFYDLPNPNAFVQDISKCLDEKGVWIIQMNYLGLMIENNTFDNISHEHLEYYSLYSLEKLLERNGMEAFDVELNAVNGGSYRIYIRKKRAKTNEFPGAQQRLEDLREKEVKMDLSNPETYHVYMKQIEETKQQLLSFLKEEISKGKQIYIYGASTRGLVVLQYCGIDNTLIKAAADKSKDKWGRQMVGTGIPIISLEQFRKDKPDYLFLLPYHILEELKVQEKEFLDNGGKIFVVIPKFEIVGKV